MSGGRRSAIPDETAHDPAGSTHGNAEQRGDLPQREVGAVVHRHRRRPISEVQAPPASAPKAPCVEV